MFQRPAFRLLDEDDNAQVVLSPKRTGVEEQVKEAENPKWRQRLRPWLPLLGYTVIAFTTLATMTYLSFFAATVDGKAPTMLGCRYFGYWTGPTCGLNGIDCQPFESDWKPIRCPTRCLWDGSSVLEVIGTGVYKGDSRICRAAIHAGVIGTNGGCAMMKYSGSRNSFEGSTANGVTSTSFDSWFPKTFEFKPTASSSYCTDLSWGILGVGFAACFGLVFLPMPPVAMVHTLCVWGFFYVAVIAAPDGYDYKVILVRLSTQVFIVVAAVQCWFHWVIQHTFQTFRTSSKPVRLYFPWNVLSSSCV
ncbi:hypothetical protein H310_14409 [Aphanomyces invadans]|uniref:LCCL domain-containing protein n=1 Tax=Aphanomyces invadans TaxID=157072 RepID=A0A024TA78_9STRA|nr:hypothetical protein H310_14409 [Aphanomyces invadans]ETV90923.1 hypothetical protein H310_14409 [Aphanomyces invadans]|eukprot:XP_008880488.1 hypothetical protein H310_14409 [Aphanomyces invadans]